MRDILKSSIKPQRISAGRADRQIELSKMKFKGHHTSVITLHREDGIHDQQTRIQTIRLDLTDEGSEAAA